MSKIVLGISAFYHDSAASIVNDGEIIAAAQEERFSRKKHDPRFPHSAINYCLEEAFIEADELDAIVFYDNPVLTWDRVIKNCLHAGEASYNYFEKAAKSILGVKLWVQEYVEKSIHSLGKQGKLLYTEHHMAHAASAFYPSPFDEAAIITLDGVGEWCTTSIGQGKDEKIELFEEINYPHSLGLVYSAFTYFCGFKVNSGEYKLMGLAPYGEPKYVEKIKKYLIDIKEDGSYCLNMEYFGYLNGQVMTSSKFNDLFCGPPRKPESPLTRREIDLAASIQEVTNEIMLLIAKHAKKMTGSRNLVLAGGVALNCVANGKVQQKNIFKEIWIQPASGDAGGSLGAALLVSHVYFKVPRKRNLEHYDRQKGSYLGPKINLSEIRSFLERNDYPYEQIIDQKERVQKIAQSIADGKIVGYFVGRMEFGPRALGARSILGDPRNSSTQYIMNMKIKYRESFRPFAPSVLLEDMAKFFEIDCESPYMLFVSPVRPERRLKVKVTASKGGHVNLQNIVNQTRSDIPAVTHVDYSARIQTVGSIEKFDYYSVIQKFKELTGVGLIVNTSFNVRGEPIVCTPNDAYKCFMRTEMDLLVLEEFLLWKEKQPQFKDSKDWKGEYEND